MKYLISLLILVISGCFGRRVFYYDSCELNNSEFRKDIFFVKIIEFHDAKIRSEGDSVCYFMQVRYFDLKDTFNIVALNSTLTKEEINRYNSQNRLLFTQNDTQKCNIISSSVQLESLNNQYPTIVGRLFYTQE